MLNGQQGDNADIMLISSRHKATNVMPTNDHYADDFAGHFAIDNAHLLVKKKKQQYFAYRLTLRTI